jgi:putative PIN family toxin of toxin-antitoxin system
VARREVASRRLLAADTNVLVSGLGWGCPPGVLVDAGLDGRIRLVSSPPLLDELGRVLRYPRLAQHLPVDPNQILRLIAAAALIVHPTRHIVAVSRDLADNRVLEAAVMAPADAVATGNTRDLRVLDEFEGIPIRTPAELVAECEFEPPAPRQPEAVAERRAAIAEMVRETEELGLYEDPEDS